MKLMHLADLHLGKRVNGFSMLEDQHEILMQIRQMIEDEQPDAVLIAGDVYDKINPPAEAVTMLDDFLSFLSERATPTFIISGNHDSAERLAFGSRIMDRGGIHFSPVYEGKASHFTLTDEFGEAEIYLLPFLREAEVRRFFPDRELANTADAVRAAVEAMDIDTSKRNIIVSHQFVAGGVTSESERQYVGGTDNVPAAVYECFDYAALGHLHGPQHIGSEKIRYSGTPLKYSFSECGHEKSVTIVTLGAKGGEPQIRTLPLAPLRDMREQEGSFEELMKGESQDYLKLILTDDKPVDDAVKRLRVNYPCLMAIEYAKSMTGGPAEDEPELLLEPGSGDPLTMFGEFFEKMNGSPMSDEQREYMSGLVGEIWKEEI